MTKVAVALTEQTFIHGVLRPAGFEVEVDETELGAKVGSTATPKADAPAAPVELTPNLQRVGRAAGGSTINYEVAAISPTGPSPTAPQAVPPATIENNTGNFTAPAEAEGDSAGVAVVAQGSERAAQHAPKRHR
jgi:hypothetical protein